jgi:hypothetical protein
MTTCRQDDSRIATTGFISRPEVRWAIAVAILPIFANLHLVFNFLSASYIFLYSGLDPTMGLVPPHPTIDFNVGVLSEAQGRRVALDIFSGIMPWWNPYEGVGIPLAGNMQSAALFPPILLLGLPNGFLYLHLLLQAVAGLFTYLLMRRLGVSNLAAFTAAVLFEFNGTFAWLPEHPVAFLPVLLYAVELEIGQIAGAWRWIAVSLALSIYAGFPEIAYIDGLLVAVWTLARLPSIQAGRRIKILCRIALGVVCGLALCAPILIAFADYLSVAFLFLHSNGFFSHQHFNRHLAVSMALPYAFGLISTERAVGSIILNWGMMGGYIGVGLPVLGLVGMIGRKYSGLRLALLLWLTFCVFAAYGLPGGKVLIDALFLSNAAFYRYFDPSFVMALVVLVGLALDDLTENFVKPRYYMTLATVAVLLVIGLSAAWPMITEQQQHFWLFISIIVALLVLGGMGFAGHFPLRHCRRILSAVVVAEALFNFLVPSFVNPRHPTLELGGIHYLQAHIGLQRVFSMGPMAPNYGTYFGIAEIDDVDYPIPANWLAFRQKHLDPYAGPLIFDGQARLQAAPLTAAQEFQRNFAAYEAVGVRYVLTRPDAVLDPGLHLSNVYSDSVMKIYQLPDPRPYFQAEGCTVAIRSRNEAVTNCPAPAALTRLELFMPGWRARVNGQAAPVVMTDQIFQQIALPAGVADVRFFFQPPFMRLGYAVFFAGLFLLCLPLNIARYRK